MPVYGAFANSTLAMLSQTHALATIGNNIANLSTGGFKATDTRFSTVLSDSLFNQSDLGGATPKDINRIDQQGTVVSSSSSLDVSINGQGFFILNTKLDGTGDTLYTRDGGFSMTTGPDTTATADDGSTITVKEGYLVDKNGYFVQGWKPAADGTFANSGTLSALRVDQFAFTAAGQPTTTATLGLNLPATANVGSVDVFTIEVIDSNFTAQTADLNFTKGSTVNTWTITASTPQTPGAQVDTVTIGATTIEAGDTYTVTVNGNAVVYTTTGLEPGGLSGIRNALVAAINADSTVSAIVTAATGGAAGDLTLTADVAGTAFTATAATGNEGTPDNTAIITTTTANIPNTTTSAPVTLTFGGNGQLTSPTTPVTLALTWPAVPPNAQGTASVALDLSNLTQFAGPFLPVNYSKNGFAASEMRSFNFDISGHVVGTFADGSFRNIYKMPLGLFSNPNALERRNGNTFALTAESGTARVAAASVGGFALFTPNTHELSNVDLTEQFSKLIQTQHAYNSAATVFKTVDELMITARDLKR
ncbi:MAG: flagellar hook-basal body complex protein [Rhodospirillales bacterium]